MMVQVGLIGLGVMGRNLALNFVDHGAIVVGFDKKTAARQLFEQARAGSTVVDIADLVRQLPSPRMIILLVPANAVDEQIDILLPLLSSGDILIDAGNSHYDDSTRREAVVARAGIGFVGLGVSGGEKGARYGPSLMAGGSPELMPRVRQCLAPLAATVNEEACFAHFGPGGAGHFVKTVHNGIEYAYMQIIAEAYFLLRHLCGLSSAAISVFFERWNDGPLASYLMEISAEILAAIDQKTGLPLVDVIIDAADQNGTGHWAIVAAMELKIPVPTIAEAVQARTLSSLRTERLRAGVRRTIPIAINKDLTGAIHDALIASKICIYAQGFAMLAAAKKKYGWPIDLSIAANVWRAGCIIRTRLLDKIRDAVISSPALPNLLASDSFATQIMEAETGWRRVIGAAVESGLPVPAMASALSYWDGYNTSRLWADLLQAHRDRFGAHGFHRVDCDGFHHGPWKDL
ncbi:MAG: NADP-dependent phosphogluconate dehydrogenase [Gammaproteobacteria bacterium]|nr:NADP-dependent phosphogluconate dehydrogenase [Gammaproteobacteria bacterium]